MSPDEQLMSHQIDYGGRCIADLIKISKCSQKLFWSRHTGAAQVQTIIFFIIQFQKGHIENFILFLIAYVQAEYILFYEKYFAFLDWFRFNTSH